MTKDGSVKPRLPLLGAVLLLGFARLAVGLHLGPEPFDDTFITLRYAKNLAAGFGLVYNIGEPVLGTTAPLWALILAPSFLVPLPALESAVVLSLLADIATAMAVAAVLVQLKASPFIAGTGAILFLFQVDALTLSRSGMETAIANLGIWMALLFATKGLLARALFINALLVFLRPECLLLGLPLVAIASLQGHSPRRILRSLASPAVLAAAWSLFAAVTYGSVIPLSITAKASHPGASDHLFSAVNFGHFLIQGQYGSGWLERTPWQANLAWFALCLVFTVITLRDWSSSDRSARLLALVTPPCLIASVFLAAGAFTWFPWYYGLFYPFMAAGAAWGIGIVSRGNRGMAVAILSLLLISQCMAFAVKSRQPRDRWIEGFTILALEIIDRGGGRIAASEIGTVGWHAWPEPIIDLVGLITPGAVDVPPEETIARLQPDFVVGRSDESPWLVALYATDWADEYALVKEWHDPQFDRDFLLFESVPRHRFRQAVGQPGRSDSPAFLSSPPTGQLQ